MSAQRAPFTNSCKHNGLSRVEGRQTTGPMVRLKKYETRSPAKVKPNGQKTAWGDSSKKHQGGGGVNCIKRERGGDPSRNPLKGKKHKRRIDERGNCPAVKIHPGRKITGEKRTVNEERPPPVDRLRGGRKLKKVDASASL